MELTFDSVNSGIFIALSLHKLLELMNYDAPKHILELQFEDLVSLSKVFVIFYSTNIISYSNFFFKINESI